MKRKAIFIFIAILASVFFVLFCLGVRNTFIKMREGQILTVLGQDLQNFHKACFDIFYFDFFPNETNDVRISVHIEEQKTNAYPKVFAFFQKYPNVIVFGNRLDPMYKGDDVPFLVVLSTSAKTGMGILENNGGISFAPFGSERYFELQEFIRTNDTLNFAELKEQFIDSLSQRRGGAEGQ